MPSRTDNVFQRGTFPDGTFVAGNYPETSRTWSNTPNFRALRAAGTPLPDQAMSYSYFKRMPSSCVQTMLWPGPPPFTSSISWTGPAHVPTAYVTPSSLITSLENQVKFDLISRAKGHQFNAPIFAAEAKKTSTMVYERAVHLTEMVRNLRRGRLDRFIEAMHDSVSKPSRRKAASWRDRLKTDPTNAASNVWLEATYGWVPFISEVQAATNTLMDVVDKPVNRVATVTAGRTSAGSIEGGEGVLYAFASGYYRIFAKPIGLYRVSARGSWRFSPGSKDLPGKFGLLNPLEVAWELVPFSFVADWFLPIGDYLSALDAPYRFTHVGGSVGLKIEEDITYVPTRWTPTVTQSVRMYNQSRSVRVSRTPLTGAPVPALTSLSWSPQLGVSRVISSISLLRQQLNRLAR
ncbi:MAG: maturation protein [Sanya fiers-like virus 56]|nr:MAG: maturation protein [Sanya fiers-like virus 56]